MPSTKGTSVGLTLMIAVVDYGIGNLRSAEKALQHLGADARAHRRRRRDRARADAVVLPGVGELRRVHAGACAASGLEAVTSDAATDGRPFLGICVGHADAVRRQRRVAGRRRARCRRRARHPAARHGAAPADGLEHARASPGSRARRRVCPIRRGATSCTRSRPSPTDDARRRRVVRLRPPVRGRGRARPAVGDAVPPREERRRRAARCSRNFVEAAAAA